MIPSNTRASRDWGIWVWNEWASSRAMSVATVEGIVAFDTSSSHCSVSI